MKNSTKVVAAVVGLLTVVLQSASAQQYVSGYIGAHPNISAFIAGVGAILALIHKPTAQ